MNPIYQSFEDKKARISTGICSVYITKSYFRHSKSIALKIIT